jgi:hypothetical protein
MIVDRGYAPETRTTLLRAKALISDSDLQCGGAAEAR